MKNLITTIGKYIRFDVDEEVLKKHRDERSYTLKELFVMNYKKDYFNGNVHQCFFNKNRNVNMNMNMNMNVTMCDGNGNDGDDNVNESGFFSNEESIQQIHENFLNVKVKRNENENECGSRSGSIFRLNDKKVQIGVVKRHKKILQLQQCNVNVNVSKNNDNGNTNVNERFYAIYERRKLLLNKYNNKHINSNHNNNNIITSNETEDEHASTDISIIENESPDNNITQIPNTFTSFNKHNKSIFLSTRNTSKLFNSFLINTNRKLMKQ